MDLGRQPGAHGAVASHSGISEAHGAADLSRGGDKRAAMERIVLPSGRIHTLVVGALAGRRFPACDDPVDDADRFGHRGQFSATGHDR